MGVVKWDLCLCLLFAWIVVYLCICKGIKSSGKVSKFNVYCYQIFYWTIITVTIITQRRKVMFLHLSVILFTGEFSVQGGLCPGVSLFRGVSVRGGGLCPGVLCPGGSLCEGFLSRGSLSRRSLSWILLHTVMCWQYASYWNLFLFGHKVCIERASSELS